VYPSQPQDATKNGLFLCLFSHLCFFFYWYSIVSYLFNNYVSPSWLPFGMGDLSGTNNTDPSFTKPRDCILWLFHTQTHTHTIAKYLYKGIMQGIKNNQIFKPPSEITIADIITCPSAIRVDSTPFGKSKMNPTCFSALCSCRFLLVMSSETHLQPSSSSETSHGSLPAVERGGTGRTGDEKRREFGVSSCRSQGQSGEEAREDISSRSNVRYLSAPSCMMQHLYLFGLFCRKRIAKTLLLPWELQTPALWRWIPNGRLDILHYLHFTHFIYLHDTHTHTLHFAHSVYI